MSESKQVFVSGERCHQAKLTDQQARDIYIARHQQGISVTILAEQHGISRVAASHICCGRTWRKVTADLRSDT